MDKKYTTITISRSLSAKIRKLAIDEGLRVSVLLEAMLTAYKNRPKTDLSFIDEDLKEFMSSKNKKGSKK